MSSNSNHWWMRGNFYSLYIDQFSGDIPTLIKKLPYFNELGIDCLHLLPHYPSPMTDGGFDISDHTGVRSDLGSVEDFKRLCAAAHNLNLKIMVDLVLNHTSIEHPWFVEARNSKENPRRNYYMWSETGTEHPDSPNPFPDFKDNNWIYNEQTNDYYFATFKPTQPELNWHNPEVLDAMLEVVEELIKQGVDGFRLDAITHLVEQEGTDYIGTPGTHQSIRAIRSYLNDHHPDKILLGEVIGTTDFSKQFFGDSDECHLSYNFELMNEILYAVRMGDSKDRLKVAVEAARLIPSNASWMAFLRNHDSLNLNTLESDRKTTLLSAIDPDKKFMFSHGSETTQRLFNILNQDKNLLKEAFSMLYAIPSASVMYYGDEIGLRNSDLPVNEDDLRYISRGKFDWEEAEQQMLDPDSIFSHVKKCIKNKPK